MKLKIVSAVLLLSFFVVSAIACGANEVSYRIGLVYDGAAYVTFDSEGPYIPMQEVTVTAIPSSGWRFDHFSYGTMGAQEGFITSYENPLTLTMYNDISLEVVSVEEAPMSTPTPTHTTTYNPTPTPTHTTTSFQNGDDAEEYALRYIQNSATSYHGEQVLAEFFDNIYGGETTKLSDGSWSVCPQLPDWVIEQSTILKPIFKDGHWCDENTCQWGVDWNCCWAAMCFIVHPDGTVQANNGNAIRLTAELQN